MKSMVYEADLAGMIEAQICIGEWHASKAGE
jgi:hypothetical protein